MPKNGINNITLPVYIELMKHIKELEKSDGNIDVSKLPIAEINDGASLTEDLIGKVIKDTEGRIYYPITQNSIDNDYAWLSIVDGTIINIYYYVKEDNIYIQDDVIEYDLSNIPSEPITPGTKLYKHAISYTGVGGASYIINPDSTNYANSNLADRISREDNIKIVIGYQGSSRLICGMTQQSTCDCHFVTSSGVGTISISRDLSVSSDTVTEL